MIVSLLFIIFLIGLLVFLLSFLIHQRKILKVLIFLMGTCLMLLAIGTTIYLLKNLL
ncbi:NADH-quinone oxidoreductase subunit K [Streptococcus parasanguinis]|uniref:NADH-quinone oxidoreductase subunit K n=1 Tax=Streptococcus parasanguinis TaxID=1318 RepID=A0A6A8V5U4_STRPA|nr:NADH-quinone oxidoreductase subunit K [Streptococcus parasanguinis]MTS01423.1 NADH-quinone oxidoreductase subunit K [Streptococcus parasanguinis]